MEASLSGRFIPFQPMTKAVAFSVPHYYNYWRCFYHYYIKKIQPYSKLLVALNFRLFSHWYLSHTFVLQEKDFFSILSFPHSFPYNSNSLINHHCFFWNWHFCWSLSTSEAHWHVWLLPRNKCRKRWDRALNYLGSFTHSTEII